MIELYQSFHSTCSAKVRLVLEEKGIPYTEHDIDLAKGEQFDPGYVKLNPKSVVPTVIHDGRVLTESSLIMEYLDEAFPEPPLKPDDPYLRYRARQFNKLLDEEVHAHTNLVSFTVFLRQQMIEATAPDEVEKRLAKLPDRAKAERQRAVLKDGAKAEPFKAAIRGMDGLLVKIDAALAEFGGPWIVGERYSLADAAVTSYVLRLEVMGFEGMWTESRPRLAAWYDAIKARPNFRGAVSPRSPAKLMETRRALGAAVWPDAREALAA